MAFLEIQFPTDISFNSVGGPGFSTDVVSFAGGTESRNQNWARPIENWNVAYGVRAEDDVKTLLQFFMVCQGRANGFRFKNWADFEVTAPNPIGTGTGALTTFQLSKRYSFAGQNYDRKISKPVSGTTTIYLNGVLQGSGWTIDITTGIVTFSSPPGNGVVVSAAFDFDVPMRFDTDALPVTLSTYKAMSTAVPLVELKL